MMNKEVKIMKKNYIAPQINMMMLANEDVMTTSAITTSWLTFNDSLDVDEIN